MNCLVRLGHAGLCSRAIMNRNIIYLCAFSYAAAVNTSEFTLFLPCLFVYIPAPTHKFHDFVIAMIVVYEL